MQLLQLVSLFSTIACFQGLKLPNYIVPCSLKDPNLNECARKHGQEALPFIIKGDTKYKIPSLVPLKLPEIKFKSGEMEIQLNNVAITGFDNLQIDDVNLDILNKHVEIKVSIEYANLLSDYNINGRILILPIRGQGPANITFVGGKYNYTFDYSFKDKKNEQYIEIYNNNLEYVTERSYYHFENLFEGDKALGEQINTFLNENWKEVQKDIGPALTQTINTIITTIVKGIFDRVPYNGIFL